VRSGINSVSAGQAEASRAVGMTFTQTLTLVVLPQAFANIIPPLTSVLIALLKNTSIAYAFGVFEGTSAMTRLITANGGDVIAILTTAALIYLALALALSFLMGRLERVVTASR
jgi:glutamate transport system permease protein